MSWVCRLKMMALLSEEFLRWLFQPFCLWLRRPRHSRTESWQTAPGLIVSISRIIRWCGHPVLAGDHLCGQTVRYRSTNQANSAFRPFRVNKWVVSCYWIYAASARGGAIWWTLTNEGQARCNLQVKTLTVCSRKRTTFLLFDWLQILLVYISMS